MPDDLEAGDARRHRRVLDVAAQGDAARRAPVAQARGDRRLRLRAARQHEPAAPSPRARARRAAGARRRRGRRRRAAARRSAPARTCARRQRPPRVQMISSRRFLGSTARRPGTSMRPPRGAMHASVVDERASAITWARTPRRSRARCASGMRPSPQTLSRGNACASTRTTSRPARASNCAAAAPAGPAPTTIASQRSGRRSRSRFMRDGGRVAARSVARPGPMRQAATMAQAVMAPTSAKVS